MAWLLVPLSLEAAKALGVSYPRMMMDIVIPQVMRAVLPAISNEAVGMLKSTSLVSVIGVSELMRAGRTVMGDSFLQFEPLLIVSVIYYILTKIFTFFSDKVEASLSKGVRK